MLIGEVSDFSPVGRYKNMFKGGTQSRNNGVYLLVRTKNYNFTDMLLLGVFTLKLHA